MKKKDMFYMILAAAIFLVAGYIAYTQLSAKKTTSKGVEVEVVGVFDSTYDPNALSALSDSSKVVDYTVPIDLSTGLNNPAPFGR
jgi:hypothetical protein